VVPAAEQAMWAFDSRTGEPMLGWSSMGNRQFEPDHVISQARAILRGIDLTALPVTMPQVTIQHFEPEPIEGVLQVGQTTSWANADNIAEVNTWLDALRAEFANQLSAAGLNPDQFDIRVSGQCRSNPDSIIQ
jgi:hypothetical protein